MKISAKNSAFLNQKCPRCHQGSLFVGKTYSLRNFATPNSHCEVCHLKFEIEPGFFTGAMYFSYAMNVAIVIVVGIFSNVFLQLHIYATMSLVLAVNLVLVPFIFRYSRMLMMYLFSGISYDEKYQKQIQNLE